MSGTKVNHAARIARELARVADVGCALVFTTLSQAPPPDGETTVLSKLTVEAGTANMAPAELEGAAAYLLEMLVDAMRDQACACPCCAARVGRARMALLALSQGGTA